MENDNSSTCIRQKFASSSFSPSCSRNKDVVRVHDHEAQQQQQNHKLFSNSLLSGISKSCAVEGDDREYIQKQYMFEKVVTPSDYFPPTSNNEKSLLLSFEDRNGKPWRFRYAYWNNSQSYVMTKGWSKFVKEKRIDAGDTVYFGRGAAESYKDRYYIDWKNKPYSPGYLSLYYHYLTNPLCNFSRVRNLAVSSPIRDHLQLNYDRQQHHSYQQQLQKRLLPSTGTTIELCIFLSLVLCAFIKSLISDFLQGSTSSPPIVHDCQAHEHQYQKFDTVELMQQNYPGGHKQSHMEMILNSVPVVHGKASTKRFRLFGVNLECLVSEDA
ncbi:hypothetical protein MKW98_011546 [Papaver atlanticum]|uniref:TF-B3 domain-containing protein n=1 Tax=Papaver atlanticum TaxID=357466 RepID=A0AAD4S9P3_9MAGN|nr:hypothetical protein MKW98_011546 [Papaver atlanticum]